MIFWQGMDMYEVEVGAIRLQEKTVTKADTNQVTITSLYKMYYSRIVRYIYAHIRDQCEAEDLGGDVFLKALQSLKSYRGLPEQMLTWLFKIAHNLVVDYMRKRVRQKSVTLNKLDIPSHRRTEEIVETKMEIESLSTALKKLTPLQREVIGLPFFAGLSSYEVSNIMGKRNGAVREMQSSAIKALRNHMYSSVG
jgi:RNA polymerase sigma-70 factor (ECF subfamily)